MKPVKFSSASLYLAIFFHDSSAPTKCASVRQIFLFAFCKWQLPTPWYGHWTRVSFAFLPWSWINSRPCAGNPCAGGSSLDDAGPRGGGPETRSELPRDAELLLILDELLARGILFAKPLTTPAASHWRGARKFTGRGAEILATSSPSHTHHHHIPPPPPLCFPLPEKQNWRTQSKRMDSGRHHGIGAARLNFGHAGIL